MTDFKTLFTEIKNQVEAMAKDVAAEYKADAIKDGKLLLNEMKSDLERWLQLLASGQLKADEFKWLVQSNGSLVKMTALKQAGMTTVQVKKFAGKLLNVIAETALQAALSK